MKSSLSIEEMWEKILSDPELPESLRKKLNFLRLSITKEASNVETNSKTKAFSPPEGDGSIARKAQKSQVRRSKVPTSLDEVLEYGESIRLPKIECERFFDHFTANGWKVSGKAPMQDWQASLRNWMRTWREKGGLSPDPTPKQKVHRLIEIVEPAIDKTDAASVFSQKMSETLRKITGGETE